MSFSIELAATLSGASVGQLRRWRATDLLRPEIHDARPAVYSFRDVVALRSFVRLRNDVSLQRIRKALGNLPNIEDLTEHPGSYTFGTDGATIAVLTEDGPVDLVKNPGQSIVATLADVFEPFTTTQGRQVPDFLRPRRHLSIDARRAGGLPTISGTRLPYENVAALVRTGEVPHDQVERFYPGVTPDAVEDAVEFDLSVRSQLRTA
ncbi:DUF433 domain-containing protein [Microbacterium sp. B19]|uniref:DUF433 domain-containing protein n=1 Tax=Microbacterium sp. B19 TaxID=96765 RepID=UPI0003B538D0|nr:DUF433 domain-containing protein [Microbacterium sp. B19]